MSEVIKIQALNEGYSYCDCCSPKKRAKNLHEISFTSGVYTSVIELCEEHLKELKEELNLIE